MGLARRGGPLLEKIGITRLSQLIIDADKDWLDQGVTDIREIAAGMIRGSLVGHNGAVLSDLQPGRVTDHLTTMGPGRPAIWRPCRPRHPVAGMLPTTDITALDAVLNGIMMFDNGEVSEHRIRYRESGDDVDIVGSSQVEETSLLNPWNHSHLNPVGGDLLLIVVHEEGARTVTAITYGGVAPTLIAVSASAPRVYVYGMTAADWPAEGAAQDLSVTHSGTARGVSSLIKLSSISPGILADVTTIESWLSAVSATEVEASGYIWEERVFLLDFINTYLGGATIVPGAGQTPVYNLNYYGSRTAGASYKRVDGRGYRSMGWTAAAGSSTMNHLVLVLLRPTGAWQYTDWDGHHFTGDLFSELVEGLTPGAGYMAMAQGRNHVGEGIWSVPTYFTTLTPLAVSEPASEITDTEARINGEVAQDGGHDCEARLRWRKWVPPVAQFDYTGAVQEYDVPLSGTYILECWGAEGGGANDAHRGKGGYATGKIDLVAGEKLYIYVGGQGLYGHGTDGVPGGWNGGGGTSTGRTGHGGSSGGGASDVRRNGTDLADRVIVAGGAGGGAGNGINSSRAGGGGAGGGGYYGGGGGAGGDQASFAGEGGTQVAGGAGGEINGATDGELGVGGEGGGSVYITDYTTAHNVRGGDGGGLVGQDGVANPTSTRADAGGGGSSYIAGLADASTDTGIREGDGRVVVRMEEEAWTDTPWQNSLRTNDKFHEDLAGLDPDTDHEFQCQARIEDTLDEGPWSASEPFKTLP